MYLRNIKACFVILKVSCRLNTPPPQETLNFPQKKASYCFSAMSALSAFFLHNKSPPQAFLFPLLRFSLYTLLPSRLLLSGRQPYLTKSKSQKANTHNCTHSQISQRRTKMCKPYLLPIKLINYIASPPYRICLLFSPLAQAIFVPLCLD